jgi:hypothetical protein
MKKMIGLCMLAVVVMSSGCASIVSKSNWPVNLNSSPTGANVTIKDKKGVEISRVVTPSTVYLKSGAGYFKPAYYTFLFEKEGFTSATVNAKAGFNGWYVGNLVFGGLLGILIVDPLTGAMWKMPEQLSASMNTDANYVKPSVTVGAPAAKADDTSDKLLKLMELKKAGVITEEEFEVRRKALVEKL